MLKKLIALFRLAGVNKPKQLLTERRMKILYNPFVGKEYWVLYDPKTRIWGWYREALPFEVEHWKTEVIGEWKGENNG